MIILAGPQTSYDGIDRIENTKWRLADLLGEIKSRVEWIGAILSQAKTAEYMKNMQFFWRALRCHVCRCPNIRLEWYTNRLS